MKLFREHRGGLAESLATTIECPNGLEDIKAHFQNDSYWQLIVKDVRIDKKPLNDNRLPDDWGKITYYVMASFDLPGNTSGVVGMSNFCE